MSDVALELCLIGGLILLNGLFSMAEMAMIAARGSRLAERAQSGDRGARAALALKESPSDFLATCQVGITLVGILAGAFGGAAAARRLEARFLEIEPLAAHAEGLALAVVVTAITLLSVLLGELVPKRLALAFGENIAASVSRPMRGLALVVAPLVHVLSRSTDLLLRPFGVRATRDDSVSEDEIRILIGQGAKSGAIDRAERQLLEGVLRLGNRRVDAVMTARSDIVWVDVNDGPAEIAARLRDSQLSRLPVADGDLDHVIGVVRAKDMLPLLLAGGKLDLRQVMLPPSFVPETLPALKLLDLFRKKRPHVAFVLDEYGGLQGLVTIGDLVEAIVGELPEIGEASRPDAVRREDGTVLVDASVDIERFRELFVLPPLADAERGLFTTVAGLVLWRLGRVPAVGEHCEWNGLRVEVVDMDGRRVDMVLVKDLREVTAAE